MRALAVFVTVLVWASLGSSATIGLYADAQGLMCSTNLGAGQTVYIQVWVDPDGPVDAGEFRVVGLPSGWTAETMLLDESLPLFMTGDPTGAGVSFSLSAAHSGRMGLCYLKVYAATDVQNEVLQVTAHASPNPPPGTPLDCAWLHYGSAGLVETPGSCVIGGRFTINGTGDCFVSVASVSWSRVRGLYR